MKAMTGSAAARIVVTLLVLTMVGAAAYAARITDPKMPEGAPTRISEHVYVIMSNPNVGIVVGSRAVLVIDTGMGAENGAAISRVVKTLTPAPKWYLTTTHFHPEHSSGEAGFPAGTLLIRPRVQQQELERDGPAAIDTFRRNPAYAP